MEIERIHIYPKEELLTAWERDRQAYQPDAERPPRCLRCGQPLERDLSINALSRALDVYVCEACGTAEALEDYAGRVRPLREWHAVRKGLLPAIEAGGSITFSTDCGFSHIFDGPTREVPMYGKRPVCEVAYSRSDYDGRKWWTTWHKMQEAPAPTVKAQEIDYITDSLFELPEFLNLRALRRTCALYAEPTGEPTEFNLYGESPSFYLWLRLITREKDYNLYVHFYDKTSAET